MMKPRAGSSFSRPPSKSAGTRRMGDLLNLTPRCTRGRNAVRLDVPDLDLAADHLMVLDKARSQKEPVTLLAPPGASTVRRTFAASRGRCLGRAHV
jgi:hypothetical protein